VKLLSASVDIALVTAGLGERPQFSATCVGVPGSRFGQDTSKRFVDIARHPPLVAADVEVGTVGDPAADLIAMLPEALLDIHLLGLITRKGDV